MKGGLGTASQKGLCLFDYMKNNEKRVKLKKQLASDPTYKEFLQRIEKIRESKNLTQSEFAEQLGVSQGCYSLFVANKRFGSHFIWSCIKLMKGDLRWVEENTEV